MKDTLLNKFNNLYKGCNLYAIHLDGFSHSVFYKDENGERHVDGYSSYAPNQYTASHKCLSTDGKSYAFKSFNEDKTKVLFGGHANFYYQNNSVEYVYKDVKEW